MAYFSSMKRPNALRASSMLSANLWNPVLLISLEPSEQLGFPPNFSWFLQQTHARVDDIREKEEPVNVHHFKYAATSTDFLVRY
jgi:hypothetical protein